MKSRQLKSVITKLQGPIIIFGAGGFIGINLLQTLLMQRHDVFGVSRDSKKNWRLTLAKIPLKNLLDCDVTNKKDLEHLMQAIKPKTVFNLTAYGAYARQDDYEKIYATNVVSTVHMLEQLKKLPFAAYIQAGSQSEYGLNAKAPIETAELIPNSHYAVSKVSNSYLLKYYGRVENLPVVHLRLYSAYGPWEDKDRLIPLLLQKARNGGLPEFVDKRISRDFVFIDDIVTAFIQVAAKMNKEMYGEIFNVATGQKTTIKDLAYLVKDMFGILEKPRFGTMQKRKWDVVNWYGNNMKIKKTLGWSPEYSLKEGFEKTIQWQIAIDYDTNPWEGKGKSKLR